MYELICPHCEALIAVAPSQAGSQIRCSACQQTVDVPKLGVLRQLPQRDVPVADSDAKAAYQETDSAPRIGMVALGLIATAALLIAGYCGIRWALIQVPVTTETHLAEVRTAYAKATPAELLRDFEQMQEASLELPHPYFYKFEQNRKRRWGLNSAIAGGVFAVAGMGAFFLGSSGRPSRKKL